MSALQDRFNNKESAFSNEERRKLNISGLLPPRIEDISLQEKRVLFNLRNKKSDLEKYIFLRNLQDSNETLFFHITVRNMEEIMPIIYTPTVGAACENFSNIYQKPRGLYISSEDKGRVGEIICNYPEKDIRVIVVTDGERILGLGDLGVNGMGIPIGKLSLYTACAGVRPDYCLPVTLDVGTNTEKYLNDPFYIGLQRKRITGQEYYELVDEFIQECNKKYPGVLIQFEDFGNTNAFVLLEKYKNQICCFNDDIQGTASVAFSGVISSLKITGKRLEDQKFLFLGAGEAALGIANLIVFGLVQNGMDVEEAKKTCWFVDSTGLVETSRKNLTHEKKEFAHDHAPISDLLTAVKVLKPTTLIGVSGQPKKFTKEIVEAMAEFNDRPVIFALSNPTSKAECSAEEAYVWSKGNAIFCSGSPFAPVSLQDGRTLVPGQGNNAYIFPAVGFAAIHTKASRINDEMFYVAAMSLSNQVTQKDLEKGCVYPPLSNIREVSHKIALDVSELIFKRGLAGIPRPSNLSEYLRTSSYEPVYQPSSCL